MLPPPLQGSLPAGWLAFTARELNPLDRDEGFQITSSSCLPGLFPGATSENLHNRRHARLAQMKRPPTEAASPDWVKSPMAMVTPAIVVAATSGPSGMVATTAVVAPP